MTETASLQSIFRTVVRGLFILTAALILGACSARQSPTNTKGHLFIIGGGSRSPEMMGELLTLAGGKEARILLIPNATEYRTEVIEEYTEEFSSLGATQVSALDFDSLTVDRPENLEAVRQADCIYFCGGDQSRITRDMLGSELHKAVLQRYRDGALIAGTSAGAAVQSRIMLTGNERLNPPDASAYNSIRSGNIETVEGLGFLDEAVIDQHFIRRKRLNRLFSVVLDNPQIFGIGIDEATAVVVSPDLRARVLGEHQVLFIDARASADISADSSGHFSASGIQVHLLGAGRTFDLKTGKVIP